MDFAVCMDLILSSESWIPEKRSGFSREGND